MKLRVNVKCDKCDWKLKEQYISDWFEKECPKCNNCIIINGKDLEAYKKIDQLTDVLENLGFVQRVDKISQVDYRGIHINIKFDSAKLR